MKVLFFSSVSWSWIKQRPHFIVTQISKKYSVDYISLIPFLKSKINNYSNKLLHIREFYVIPLSLKFPLIQKLNIKFIKSKINWTDYDIIILTNPLQLEYIPYRELPNVKIIYDCMDDIPCFYEAKIKNMVLEKEKKLLMAVHKIIVSSDNLKKVLESRIENYSNLKEIKVIYNAVDKHTFSSLPKKIILKKPNLVYIGTVGKWLDYDLIYNFAKNNKNYYVYIIGPRDIKVNTKIKNIIFIDHINYEQVKDYVASGDCMIIPFIVNNLIKSVDPVKIYEYISYNKCIISSFWEELKKFEYDNLFFYNDYEEFDKIVKSLLLNKTEVFTFNRNFIDINNWENRSIEYMRCFDE